MIEKFQKLRSSAQEIVYSLAFAAKLKLTELWSGDIAAREMAAAQYLRDMSSRIRTPEYAAKLPGYKQFLSDLRELSAQAMLPTPYVHVISGGGCPGMITRDKLIMPELMFFACDAKKLKAIIGHELGHVANGDLNTAPFIIPRRTHREEYAADKFGAKLTNDPDSLIDIIKTINSKQNSIRDRISHPKPVDRIARLENLKNARTGNFASLVSPATSKAGRARE